MTEPEHEGIDSGPIVEVMLAAIGRMLLRGAVLIGMFCLGFWMGRGF